MSSILYVLNQSVADLASFSPLHKRQISDVKSVDMSDMGVAMFSLEDGLFNDGGERYNQTVMTPPYTIYHFDAPVLPPTPYLNDDELINIGIKTLMSVFESLNIDKRAVSQAISEIITLVSSQQKSEDHIHVNNDSAIDERVFDIYDGLGSHPLIINDLYAAVEEFKNNPLEISVFKNAVEDIGVSLHDKYSWFNEDGCISHQFALNPIDNTPIESVFCIYKQSACFINMEGSFVIDGAFGEALEHVLAEPSSLIAFLHENEMHVLIPKRLTISHAKAVDNTFPHGKLLTAANELAKLTNGIKELSDDDRDILAIMIKNKLPMMSSKEARGFAQVGFELKETCPADALAHAIKSSWIERIEQSDVLSEKLLVQLVNEYSPEGEIALPLSRRLSNSF